MDFNKIHYLLAVAELQSFSKAAEKCFTSQPALTRCIKSMEQELGVKLFDLSSSPIRLTYAGERYVAGMRKILAMKGKLDQEMEEIANARRDRLVVGMPSTRCHTWLPRILPAYHEENPGVEIQLIEGNGIAMGQQLQQENIDIYFMSPWLVLTADLEFVPLFEEEMTVVVSRQCALFKGLELPPNRPGVLQYIPPKALEKIPFISPTSSNGTYYTAQNLFESHQLHPSAAMELINPTTAYLLAPEGGGFALAPVSVIREEHFSPEPIFCSIEPTPTVRSVGLMYKRGRELSHAAKRFIETAQREIPAYVRANAVSYQVAREIDLTGRL